MYSSISVFMYILSYLCKPSSERTDRSFWFCLLVSNTYSSVVNLKHLSNEICHFGLIITVIILDISSTFSYFVYLSNVIIVLIAFVYILSNCKKPHCNQIIQCLDTVAKNKSQQSYRPKHRMRAKVNPAE